MAAVDNNDILNEIEAYLYDTSHELKAPLSEILMYARIIEEDSGERLEPQSRQDLLSIQNICNRSIEMINMFMDYAKIRNTPLNKEIINLKHLVAECADNLKAASADRDITITIKNLPKIISDKFLLQQIINNIISNSIKYTKDKEHAIIKIFSRIHGDRTIIYFEDNGQGFSSEYASKAFQVFQRFDDSSETEGHGIGLSIVKKIADRLGGQVDIFAVKGQSCTVSVSLPNSIVINASKEREIRKLKQNVIRIGVLGATSGEYSGIAPCRKYAYELAVEEINKNGGVLGKKLELLFRDFKSDETLVPDIVWELAAIEQVDVLMGGQLSSAREYIRDVADKLKIPYFFNALYEGGLADHYTFCIGSAPEQNVYPVIDQLLPIYGGKCYIIASDYNYGVLTAEAAKNYISKKGGIVAGVEYFSPEKREFLSSIENIKRVDPDMILSFCVGNNQEDFYRQWYDKGIHEIPIISTIGVGLSHLHKILPAPLMRNNFFMCSYLEELDSAAAVEFTKKLRDKYDTGQIPYIEFDAETAYSAIYLYKAAVEKCGNTNTEAVIKALESGDIFFDGPGGRVAVRGKDHHVIRDEIIFRVDKRHNVEKVSVHKKLKTDFVLKALEKDFGCREGLKELGLNSPNVQYNMIYKRLN